MRYTKIDEEMKRLSEQEKPRMRASIRGLLLNEKNVKDTRFDEYMAQTHNIEMLKINAV